MNQAFWVGVYPGLDDSRIDYVAESLRSAVRKADAPLFCHLLRCLATDPKRMRAFTAATKTPPVVDDAISRLEQLIRRGDGGGKAEKRKPAAQKSAKGSNHSSRSRVGSKKRH
jgi:hypothetical protein